MRFSRALKNRYGQMDEYDILNLPPEQFREYLNNLKRRYDEHMRMQEEEDIHSQTMGSEVEENLQNMAPSERQELVDEGFVEE